MRYVSARVNGLPGLLVIEAGRCSQTAAFKVRNGRIGAIYSVRNPDKLARISV